MVIECSIDELREKYDKINHCLYASDHGTVYKNCRESYNCPSFVDERIKFVSSLGKIDSFNYPIGILADENGIVYGYESNYYPNYQTIAEYIRDDNNTWLSFDEKKHVLLEIHKALRETNKSFIVGDINLANVLISKFGDGIMIDWENGVPVQSTLEPLNMYDIKFLTLRQNDAIKMFITSISLLYGISFEQYFSRITVDRMLTIAKELKMPRPIIHYLEAFVYEVMSYTGRVIYFDEFLEEMYGISRRSYNNTHEKYANFVYQNGKY